MPTQKHLKSHSIFNELQRTLTVGAKESTWGKALKAYEEWTEHFEVTSADMQFLIIVISRIDKLLTMMERLAPYNTELKRIRAENQAWLKGFADYRDHIEHMYERIKRPDFIDLEPFVIGMGYEFTMNTSHPLLDNDIEKQLNILFADIITALGKL